MAQVTQIKPAALETAFAPVLEAIAISSDNTETSKDANKTAIATYITSLKNLGVDVTSGFAPIPIMLDGEYAGYIQQVNASANWYAGVLKGGSQINILNGEVTVKDLCYNEPSGLTTTAQTVAGAINEVNAKAGDAQEAAEDAHSATDIVAEGIDNVEVRLESLEKKFKELISGDLIVEKLTLRFLALYGETSLIKVYDGTPDTAPDFVPQFAYNKATGDYYKATGSASVSNWAIL